MNELIGADMHLKVSEDPNIFSDDGAMKELVEVFLLAMKQACLLRNTSPTHLILAWDNAKEGEGYSLTKERAVD